MITLSGIWIGTIYPVSVPIFRLNNVIIQNVKLDPISLTVHIPPPPPLPLTLLIASYVIFCVREIETTELKSKNWIFIAEARKTRK